jgi:hypothetical protein
LLRFGCGFTARGFKGSGCGGEENGFEELEERDEAIADADALDAFVYPPPPPKSESEDGGGGSVNTFIFVSVTSRSVYSAIIVRRTRDEEAMYRWKPGRMEADRLASRLRGRGRSNSVPSRWNVFGKGAGSATGGVYCSRTLGL